MRGPYLISRLFKIIQQDYSTIFQDFKVEGITEEAYLLLRGRRWRPRIRVKGSGLRG